MESRAARLGDLRVEEYLRDPSRKQAFVTPMFDRIAPRYDEFTRLFSFGMDAGWKRAAVHAVAQSARDARHALDLACGTGDLAVALARALPQLQVLGLDASNAMVTLANARIESARGKQPPLCANVRVAVGDMMSLCAGRASMDVVTAGYGVRNVPEPRAAIREMARVLRPGGVLVTLDFYRPAAAIWRHMLLAYLSVAGNVVGWWWHRDPIVYGYIARSIDHFMSWQAFSSLLVSEGFSVPRVERHLGGGIALHVAVRTNAK